MTPRKGGLGRGLDAMISETAKNPRTSPKKTNSKKTAKQELQEKKEEGTVFTVKMTQIEPNRKQPRKQFDEDALLELAESIKQFGVLQPLLVRKKMITMKSLPEKEDGEHQSWQESKKYLLLSKIFQNRKQ